MEKDKKPILSKEGWVTIGITVGIVLLFKLFNDNWPDIKK